MSNIVTPENRLGYRRPLYDFQLCVGLVELKRTISEINRTNCLIRAVTQDGEIYTVFFERPAYG